jgi:urocanate hydratase
MIAREESAVRVLHSRCQWHGVTYREDRASVASSIARMVEAGEYSTPLWKTLK